MLSIQKQPRYIERKIQLPNGSWALVVFELLEVNGKIIAKAIGAKFIDESVVLGKEEILALPVCCETQNILPLVSPFFAEVEFILKDLSFVVTQPARAPNF